MLFTENHFAFQPIFGHGLAQHRGKGGAGEAGSPLETRRAPFFKLVCLTKRFSV